MQSDRAATPFVSTPAPSSTAHITQGTKTKNILEDNTPKFTLKEKAGIYLNAMLYGFATSVEFGLGAACCGYFIGAGAGALYYPCAHPDAFESCFTSAGAIRASGKGALYAGVTTMFLTFVPAVSKAVDEGFIEAARYKNRNN